MKELELEDLTKQELIELIKNNIYFVFSFKQRDLIEIKWKSKNKEASRIMGEAVEEQALYSEGTDMTSLAKWDEASPSQSRIITHYNLGKSR
ncbi:hypothetical protein LCGC14_0406280 [marine sediment metagenome]|uniref:Uncharacterized protein n=1 Tax=marine sediment metagenome TaxID=412755 RepID=A0A0F9T100_9ZZZZ